MAGGVGWRNSTLRDPHTVATSTTSSQGEEEEEALCWKAGKHSLPFVVNKTSEVMRRQFQGLQVQPWDIIRMFYVLTDHEQAGL